MTITRPPIYSDLSVDYAVGEILESLSVLDTRGVFPPEGIPYVRQIEQTLGSLATLPPHVTQAVNEACLRNGYTGGPIMASLRQLGDEGHLSAGMSVLTIRGFLLEWRKYMKAFRPTPVFGRQN